MANMQQQIKRYLLILMLTLGVSVFFSVVHADPLDSGDDMYIDRIQLVTQQIDLLKNRLNQSKKELTEMQEVHDQQLSQVMLEKASKNLLVKASLDVSVSRSNLDSINIELSDSQQSINWLEKSTQEIENQLNVLNIFGLKVARAEAENIKELHSDLDYQRHLLDLERDRLAYLQELQASAKNILALKKERYNRLNEALKSSKMLLIKQQQIKDELAFQELQNNWLEQLNILYGQLGKIDPVKSKEQYSAVERDIFYANEKANFAYFQSLVARYKDQIQQMRLAVTKSNSISVLNEIGDQVLVLQKQIARLDTVLKSRVTVMDTHISYLSKKKRNADALGTYIDKLSGLKQEYIASDEALIGLTGALASLRVSLDQALQVELSARQGFPTFELKTVLDLGKEMLLVPALAFQVVKSLSSNLMRCFYATTAIWWDIYAFTQGLLLFALIMGRRWVLREQQRSDVARDKYNVNARSLGLQWLKRNFADIFIMANLIGTMMFFGVPAQNYLFLVYLGLVWIIFKNILFTARVWLVETTHDTTGHDVRLYYRLKWVFWSAGFVTALTVFIHQLPLIYELKTLCDRIFLFFLMVASVMVLRSWHVVSNLILSHMEQRHPYIQRVIKLVGITLPILMFANAAIGLLGYVNLVMTVSWYEGIFMLVFIGYLALRGLLSDGMEHLSRLMIQYVNNGWLWTEAFLKPIDKILQMILVLSAGALLFLLYGWDKQSPIVERLTRLLNYQLISFFKIHISLLSVLQVALMVSVFYWTAKWTREFVYRLLASRTKDMGIRNSIAVISQYAVVLTGAFICMRVLGIDLNAIAMVTSMLAFGIGFGLRDLANNFVSGFLILLERPLRVGDIVNIAGVEGEVTHIGGRAVTVRTWDRMELVVPNAEIFNKSFTNWTSRDNIVRTVVHVKISRHDNPHQVCDIIQSVLVEHKEVLKDPAAEVYLREMSDTLMDFELRYFVNIRQVKSRVSVASDVLMNIWDAFAKNGIKAPFPKQEIFIRGSELSSPLGYTVSTEAN